MDLLGSLPYAEQSSGDDRVRIRIGPAIAGGVVAAAAAVATAGVRWSRATADAVGKLARATAGVGPPGRYSPAELEGLPAPVVRYFQFALTPDQPLARHARVHQRGEFATKPGEWRRMRATQTFWVKPPGFVWDAAITMGPGVDVRVRDGYFGGSATMKAAIGGLIPVANRADTPGLAEGALLRYLAEAPVIPAALLPSAGVSWTPLGDSSARATLSDAGLTVSMDVHFGESGEITRINADRYRDVGGSGVATPFIGRWREYRRLEGMMVPGAGDATWVIDGAPFTFWRAKLTEASFEY